MARKNNFEKTKYRNIFSLKNANNRTEYYANFMLDGVSYQKKNFSKLFGCTTAKQASDRLEEVKTELRKGNDPFSRANGLKVKDIVLKSIRDRKSDKDNTRYKKSLTSFYNLYIHPVIGHLKLDKVNDNHVKKILESIDGLSKTRKLSLNVLMFKIFEDEFRKGNIRSNPFYNLDYGTHNSKASFDIRLNEPMEEVAKKLYRAALEFPSKHKLILLMSIMLARRMGELYALKCSHIKKYTNGEYYVLTTKDITKTGIEEKYPLPQEVIDLLPSDIFNAEYKNEPLFSFCYSGIYGKWNQLLKDANIELNSGHKLTSHDNRYLFLSILSAQGIDSDLVDRCLSHNNVKNIKQIYLDVSYDKRKKIFEAWWELLRS